MDWVQSKLCTITCIKKLNQFKHDSVLTHEVIYQIFYTLSISSGNSEQHFLRNSWLSHDMTNKKTYCFSSETEGSGRRSAWSGWEGQGWRGGGEEKSDRRGQKTEGWTRRNKKRYLMTLNHSYTEPLPVYTFKNQS